MNQKFYIEFTLSDLGISNFCVKNSQITPAQPVNGLERLSYQNLLAKNRIEFVIQELRVLFPTNGILINLSAQWQAIDNQLMLGLLEFKEAIPLRARICQSLIDVLEDLFP